jgi:hypothetical protein
LVTWLVVRLSISLAENRLNESGPESIYHYRLELRTVFSAVAEDSSAGTELESGRTRFGAHPAVTSAAQSIAMLVAEVIGVEPKLSRVGKIHGSRRSFDLGNGRGKACAPRLTRVLWLFWQRNDEPLVHLIVMRCLNRKAGVKRITSLFVEPSPKQKLAI